ncbi:hypothetical protein F4604DRAFT_1935130 [Suillus subluteus]|nr:hypothetical protein F4604DRAFT_1935130 [Suillus subluteus]
MTSCLEDFPNDNVSELADYAAGIARRSITDRTRDGHARIIKAYIVFHKRRNAEWGPTIITCQTPYDIRAFITHKCGEKDKGYEGKKFSAAVSTRAALSYWYWHCRPNDSVTEWHCDENTSVCAIHGYKLVTTNTCRKHESKDARDFEATKQLPRAPATHPITQPSLDHSTAVGRDLSNMSMDSSPTLVSPSLPASPILWPADDGGDFYNHDYDTPLEVGDTDEYDHEMLLDLDQRSDVDFGGQIQVDEDTGIDHVPLPQDALPPESIPPVPPPTNNNDDGEPEDPLTLVPAFRQTPPKHLGLQVDDYLDEKAICTKCNKFYSPRDIQNLLSPDCTVRRCQGIVYRTKHERPDEVTGEERSKQIPAKILTYCPLIKAVERFLLRPTFIDNMRDTAVDKDRHPLTDDELMQDIYDGTEWLKQVIGLKRVVEQDGSIINVEATPGSRCSLFSCEVGLSMTINIDWFGITDNRPHSARAIYISFNNLHHAVRYLTQNVHLAMVIPGPKEPSLEQLNHCLEPLCTELHTIYKDTPSD